jgi:hypothetical protein
VGANAEAAKGQIGAALEKYLPGKKPPPPPAAPAAPAARKAPIKTQSKAETPVPQPQAAKPAAPKAAAIKAKSKERTTAVTPAPYVPGTATNALLAPAQKAAGAAKPVEAKAEAAVPAQKTPVLERRIERQVLRTAQRIENAKVPEKLKGKWTRDLAALRSTLRAMQAARINAPFDEKGHYKDKVAPAAEKVTPESVRAQQAADKAEAAAAAHRAALAKLDAAHADAARPTKSKGAQTTRIKKLTAARKAEAEARTASEEAAKEHRRASLLFEGSRAALGATAEAVPPLKAQYAGKYTHHDATVASVRDPQEQRQEAGETYFEPTLPVPHMGPQANDLLGDKHELAAARAEVRASKFADTVDGLRRRLEAVPEGKEHNAERNELARQVRDMEYAAELASDRAEELRVRARKAKGEQPAAPGKQLRDGEILKRVQNRARASETVASAAKEHNLSVEDMVSLVMRDIKSALNGNDTVQGIDNLPFTELFNRARLRAKEMRKSPNAQELLATVRRERAQIDNGEHGIRPRTETLQAEKEAAEQQRQPPSEEPDDNAVEPSWLDPSWAQPGTRAKHVGAPVEQSPRYVIGPDGEIMENPERKAADEAQNPNREMEEAAKAAEHEEQRGERLRQYMANMGLGSSMDQTTMRRARASKKNGFRAAMAGFMNEDGSLKKWEHISKATKRIYDEYKGAGKEVPDIIKKIVFHDLDVATRRRESGKTRGPLTPQENAVRQDILNDLVAGKWDDVAAQTLTTARSAAVARTPESVFMNNAPADGIANESLAEQTDRVNRMVKEFVALQNSGFNMDGKQARSGARANDHYLKLMKRLIAMTDGGKKPLAYTEIPLKEGFQSKGTVAERDRRFRANHEVSALLGHERVLRSGDLQSASYTSQAGSSFNENMGSDEDISGDAWAEGMRGDDRLASMDGMYAKAGEPGVIDRSMSGAEALQAAWPNPDPVVGSLVNALSERVGNVPVHVVSASELEAMAPGRNANMLYDPDTGTIYVKPGLDAGVERAGILEELWHAATAEAIYNDPELRAMGTELQRVFAQNNPGYNPTHLRYFSELGELSAHGMLNPEFKARIDGIPLPAKVAERLGVRPKTSMLQAIFQRVLKFLGLRPETKEATLLEGIMHWNQKLYQATRPGGGIDEAPARALASMADLPVLGKAVQNARTAASNQAPEARRTLLGLLYMTDITAKYGGMFHWNTGKRYLRMAGALNPVHQFELATRKRAAATKRMEQEDGPMLDRHRALVVHDPKMATAMHRLAIDATHVGIDPTGPAPPRTRQDTADGRTAKREFEKLQARYNALTPEAKAVFNGMRDSVKAKANAFTREAIVDIARRRWQNAHDATKPGAALPPGIPPQPLSPQQERDLAERFVQGKETDADKALMGEAGVAVANDFISNLNSQQFYLPLSRRGEFVVTGFRTDYQADNFFDHEADAEAFASKAMNDGVPLQYRIQRAAFAPDGTQIKMAEASSVPGAVIKHWVKLQPQITEMFETRSDAIARQREYENLPNVKISGVEQRKAGTLSYQRELPPSLQAQISRAVGAMASNAKDKDALTEMLQEAYVRFMPGANVRHATVKRRNVRGASEDMLAAMGSHTISSAQYRGSLQYGAFQRAGLQAQEDVVDGERFTAGGKRDNFTRLQVIAEQRARQHTTEADASASSPFWKAVQRYVAVHYLGSPSYALLQLTQTPLMGPGVMARLFPNAGDAEIIGALHHGHNAVGGLSGTFWDLGKEKFARAWKKWADANPENVEFLERVKRNVAETNPAMAKEYGALLDEMARRGVIDETAGLETTQMVKDLNAGALKRGWNLVEDLSRAFPASAEVYNRSSVAVAAYQLARDKGMSVEQATELADQAILGIHFDYSAHNAPRLMNEANKWGGGVLSPFLTFKKYVAAVYGQMGLSLMNSVRGQSPEVRRAARRQFTRMMLAHGAAAGVMGLPWEPIKLALGAVAMLTGKDEPWDIEDDLRDALIKQFGGGADGVKWANIILHGLPQLANADFADRVGLENLALGRGPDDFTADSWKKYGFDLVAGAAGGVVSNALLARKTYMDTGNLAKAAEQMAPKFIKDALAAYEMATGGKKNAKGEDIAEGLLGPSDAVWRALGFNSAMEKNLQRERSNRFQEKKAGEHARSQLHKVILKDREAGNTANEDAIIAAHNEKHPDYPITEKSLKSAASRANSETDPGKKYLGVKVPKSGLSPSKYVPELSGGQITQDREIGRARAYAPTKDQITSPAMQAITGAVSQNEHPFFASIIRAEGTGRDGDPYNEVLGYGAYGRPPKPLTEMTLREVYNFGLKMRQAQAARGKPWRETSSASGAFQIVGETMKNLMGEAGLSWDDKFNRYNQQQLALVIAEKQGVKPSTWEGFRRKPWLLAQARQHFNSMEGRDV